MFEWYKLSSICYAYLVDVSGRCHDADEDGDAMFFEQFTNSRWFKRGWTLQELIAPRNVRFFSKEWTPFGVKAPVSSAFSEDPFSEASLTKEISNITGVDMKTLNGGLQSGTSVARKMSCASRRETTRIEDIAYSLIGLFGVNMPLLYGEGHAAFLRLQEEIMKTSADETIFAWEDKSSFSHGALAESPSRFAFSSNIAPTPRDRMPSQPAVSRGFVRLAVEVRSKHPVAGYSSFDIIGLLDCSDIGRMENRTGIFLHVLSQKEVTVYGDKQGPVRNATRGFSSSATGSAKKRLATRMRQHNRKRSWEGSLIEFDSSLAEGYPHSEHLGLFVHQGKRSPLIFDEPPAWPTFRFSLIQEANLYRVSRGWPNWNPIILAVEDVKGNLAAAKMESDNETCLPFAVFAQVSRDIPLTNQKVFIVTDTENLESWLGNMATEGGSAVVNAPEAFVHDPVSKAELATGLQGKAHISVENPVLRRYLVKIDIRQTVKNSGYAKLQVRSAAAPKPEQSPSEQRLGPC